MKPSGTCHSRQGRDCKQITDKLSLVFHAYCLASHRAHKVLRLDGLSAAGAQRAVGFFCLRCGLLEAVEYDSSLCDECTVVGRPATF